ncbi:MAG: DUF3990 domain-containing protein [Phocaeicola vulgatus]|nr:DUF3990 domain-containing protein [Lachnospiraceae bacterium]MDY2674717.1 DUF3990 domain-containing protein [Phocaeicola vulgatus]
MYHQIKLVLYHGTISEIGKVDVSLGRGRKDFGRGFYMAVTRSQAIGMMHKKYREAVRRSRNKDEQAFCEYLYEIHLDEAIIKSLSIKVFENADVEWLDFILMCREQGGVPHTYDMVIGPTADDDTALCLKAYQDGLYGKRGSQEAKRILLNNLETENLGIQYYIGKQEVADRIIKKIIRIEWR